MTDAPNPSGPEEFREFWQDGLRISKALDRDVELIPGPDVWWCYAKEYAPSRTVDLLVEPGEFGNLASRNLAGRLEEIGEDVGASNLAQGFGHLTVELTFTAFVRTVLPLTGFKNLVTWAAANGAENLARCMAEYREGPMTNSEDELVGWFAHLIFVVMLREPSGEPVSVAATPENASAVLGLLRSATTPSRHQTFRHVTLNRRVRSTVARSRRTVKTDAAARLFDVSCKSIRWAVVDSGIDARHFEFRDRMDNGEPFVSPFEPRNEGEDPTVNHSRIDETLDFTRFRAAQRSVDSRPTGRRRAGNAPQGQPIAESGGDGVPGDVVLPMLFGEAGYVPPGHGHGTHVAGIIGGSTGLCPDIRLVDLRVLDKDAAGDEFAVLMALQYVIDRNRRHLDVARPGRTRDLYIHGVNLSLSLNPDVTSDACGWSMVCRACDELVRSGVVVVVAAGNDGYEAASRRSSASYGHTTRTVSIADPGNTERVITVGSTHPDRPLEYGVSYFSARGPTADGRMKPDLVAPGEDILAAHGYLNDDGDMDGAMLARNGTSQAAAHVSGAAAMLLARNRELIGKPEEVKRILCATATDLGRDRTFQGHGLVDALRALQEI